MNVPKINTPRQRRFLKHLLSDDESNVVNLREYVGALNIPEIKAQLERFGWRINCTRVDFQDRDGNTTKPGIYWIHPDMRHLAIIAIYG